MEILGIGPLEAIFIVLLALIAIGPRDLGTAARSLGRTLNRVYRSEAWQSLTQASRNLRGLPNRLAREAALEELDQVRRDLKDGSGPPPLPGRATPAAASDAGPTPQRPVSPQAELVNSGGSVGPGGGSPVGGEPLPEKTRATKLPSGVVSRRKTSRSSTRSPGDGAGGKVTATKKRPARSGARKKGARVSKRPSSRSGARKKGARASKRSPGSAPRKKSASSSKRRTRSGPRKSAGPASKRPPRSGPRNRATQPSKRPPRRAARGGRPS